MKNKIKEIGLSVVLIFVFSYVLNFVWEAFHAVFLYQGHNFDSLRYIPMISYVSVIDGLLILLMYGLVALLWRNILWVKQTTKLQLYVMMAIGLAIATFIEYRAVVLQFRWSYTTIMPTVFGLGLSPLVQLSITGLLAVGITKMLLYQKGAYHD